MGHHHSHNNTGEGKNLFFTILLNFFITIVEIIGGLLTNSLSLLSDALHNLSDALALLISYIALRISRKDPNTRRTFGYKRIQIISALFNAVTLVVISIFLIFEAYQRFLQPEDVKSLPMIIVASIGLLANLLSVFLLKGFSKGNLNIKSAYLHLIGDTLSSVAVIIGGLLMYFYELYWIDPLITVLISIYIVKETISVLVETNNILMQGTPKDIDVLDIEKKIRDINEIENIHHVHIWNLSDQEIHFEAHVNLLKDLPVSKSEIVILKIRKLLKEEFNIDHVTLQIEYNFCKDNEIIFIDNNN